MKLVAPTAEEEEFILDKALAFAHEENLKVLFAINPGALLNNS